MPFRAFPLSAAWRRRDPWLLLFATAAWMPIGWWHPDARLAALPGLGLTLLLCKALAMPPILRAFIAPFPAVVSLHWLGASGPFALAGAILAASAYLAFTMARHGVHLVRGWRFRTADGSADGWDYGKWLIAREGLHAWLWPRPRRILFPPTDMEAALREGFPTAATD